MVEVDATTPLIGERGTLTLLDTFEGRRMLIALLPSLFRCLGPGRR